MKNLPHLAGQLAAPKRLFGDHSRFAIAPVHTRGDAVEWFVWDAQTTDPVTGLPDVVRQEPTEDEAMKGLPLDAGDDWLDCEVCSDCDGPWSTSHLCPGP